MLEETLIFIQIIFIDIVMAADNAIIIGMVAANFAPKSRKQIIMWGVFAAFIFSSQDLFISNYFLILYSIAASTFRHVSSLFLHK